MFRAVILILGLLTTAILFRPDQTPAQAQTAPDPICPAVPQDILTQISRNCNFDKIDSFPDSACYASDSTLFTLSNEDVPTLGSIVALDVVQGVRTGASGVAVLNLVPTGATEPFNIVLMGDAVVDTAEAGDASSIYLSTSTDACANVVPSAVAITSRSGGEQVTLTVNGASVTQGSTTIFRIIPPANTLQIIVTEGEAILQSGAVFNAVRAGETSFICLDKPDNLGSDGLALDQQVSAGCNWSTPRTLNDEENAYAGAVQQVVGILGGSSTTVAGPGGTCTNGGTTLTHTVRRGEVLWRIAARYSTTTGAIAAENKIGDVNTIFAGQQLTISCAIDTGFSTVPSGPGPVPTIVVPPITG